MARARGVCALIFAVIAASIAPYHVMFIGIWVEYRYCAILRKHEAAFYVLYVVEMFIFRLVPVAVISVLNAFIIRRVTGLARTKRQWMTPSTPAKSRLDRFGPFCTARPLTPSTGR